MEFNDAQRAALSHKEGPMMVLAGPGSGKTTVITHRIQRLLEQGVSPSGILVITFTKAAAAEMKERETGQLWNLSFGLLPNSPAGIPVPAGECDRRGGKTGVFKDAD